MRADNPFEYESDSEVVRALILAGLDGPAPVKTAAAELKERKLLAEVEQRERENAKASAEVIAIDEVVAVVTKKCEPIRQAIQQVANAVDGLTDDQRGQLDKWREDTLTNLSGDNVPWL
jgi:Arc/MetJ-type ribon-helix-helix transcriptional regulator